MALLRSFETAPELGITELAARHQLSPSTAHRIARALVDAGFLEQDERTERYRLGVGLAELGLLTLRRIGVDHARPLLEELSAATGESVNLGVRRGDSVLVLVRVVSDQPLRFEQPEGSSVPIHTSAMGKALLAFSADPEAEVEGLAGLQRLTAHTITSKASLRADLQRVRDRGYSLNDEERNIGVRAVGAPVLSPDGVADAAIVVQGPTVRLTDRRIAEIVPMVTATAAQVAATLALGQH